MKSILISIISFIISLFKSKQVTPVDYPTEIILTKPIPTVIEDTKVEPIQNKEEVNDKSIIEVEKPIDKPKPIEVIKVDKPVTTISKQEPIKPQIKVKRTTFTDQSTIGELLIDDKFICYTLEDVDRKLESGGKKIYGETAIPRGTYEVKITYSERFNKMLPLLIDVPQFEGIRMHIGNFKENTHGCILLGYIKDNDKILNSTKAVDRVIAIIIEKLKQGKIFIKVE